jgi:hypothetical protein
MIFKDNEADTDRLDYQILRDDGVCLHFKKTVFIPTFTDLKVKNTK